MELAAPGKQGGQAVIIITVIALSLLCKALLLTTEHLSETLRTSGGTGGGGKSNGSVDTTHDSLAPHDPVKGCDTRFEKHWPKPTDFDWSCQGLCICVSVTKWNMA